MWNESREGTRWELVGDINVECKQTAHFSPTSSDSRGASRESGPTLVSQPETESKGWCSYNCGFSHRLCAHAGGKTCPAHNHSSFTRSACSRPETHAYVCFWLCTQFGALNRPGSFPPLVTSFGLHLGLQPRWREHFVCWWVSLLILMCIFDTSLQLAQCQGGLFLPCIRQPVVLSGKQLATTFLFWTV